MGQNYQKFVYKLQRYNVSEFIKKFEQSQKRMAQRGEWEKGD